jgi:hypothetical protein
VVCPHKLGSNLLKITPGYISCNGMRDLCSWSAQGSVTGVMFDHSWHMTAPAHCMQPSHYIRVTAWGQQRHTLVTSLLHSVLTWFAGNSLLALQPLQALHPLHPLHPLLPWGPWSAVKASYCCKGSSTAALRTQQGCCHSWIRPCLIVGRAP